MLIKYPSYTALNSAKSPMSARKQVVFKTEPKSVPAASRITPTFLQDCSAWVSIVSPETAPVAGSTGIWPEINYIFPETLACEYGPIAAGAFAV